MKLRKTIVAALSVSLVLLMAVAVMAPAVHDSGLPKIGTIYYKAYPEAAPEVIVQEFLDCETDWIEGPGRSDLYNSVVNAGHNVSIMNNMSEFTFFPINGRDYKVTSGEPNAPLNSSAWRLALSYVYGSDDKQADVFGYYGVPWFSALNNPVPPAQEPWYDAATQMPITSNVTAWSKLSAAGYTIADYKGQQWLHANGTVVRPPDGPNGGVITFLYSTGSLVYPNGPGGGMVRNWNAFITDYMGAEGPLMTMAATDFGTLVTDLLSTRNFDIIGIGLTNLGVNVDWIFDCFHSDNDVDWGWNFCGTHDADYDRWGEIILTSMDPAEIQEACENWTRKFVGERMDWLPAITGLDFTTTKVISNTNFLTNLIPMENYGSRNDYSWMCLHWYGTPDVVWPGGSYSAALGDEPHTLNPWTEDTLYGWELMSRALSSLTSRNPVTLNMMPWVATKWTLMNWTSIPELGIDLGATAQFLMRQDVMWQDSSTTTLNDGLDLAYFDPNPVDAYDCVANMRFMRLHKPGRYSSTWAHLVYEESDGAFKFNVYFDQTSLYHSINVAGTALLVPEHIIELVEDYWETWAPCDGGQNEGTYDDLTGDTNPVSYMKQLVGCSAFNFRYYDRSLSVGQVEAYTNHFVSKPVLGSVVGEWRIDPNSNYTYEVLIHNIGAKTDDNYGNLASVEVDVAIYEDDVPVHTVNDTVLDPWEHKYLPGSEYVWQNVACGPHTIKVVVTGDDFTHEYEHLFVATIRYDVSTYSGSSIDFTTDMVDIARAAKAFGSGPGHLRWDPPCDVNDDFYVDMVDIATVAKYFGWSC